MENGLEIFSSLLCFIYKISVGIDLNTESSADYYKEKKGGSLVNVEFKMCRLEVTRYTWCQLIPHFNRSWYKGTIKSGRYKMYKV